MGVKGLSHFNLLCIYLSMKLFFLQGKDNTNLNYQDLSSNSLYCLTYNSFNVNLENLILDQLKIPYLIFYFIFVTSMHDIVLIL